MADHGFFTTTAAAPHYLFFGVSMRILLSPTQTGGQFALVEGIMPAHGDGGLHVHHRDDESMTILEGTLEVTIGGETRLLGEGDSYFAPRGVPHRLHNPGPGAMRSLLIATPGEFASFIAEAAVSLNGTPSPDAEIRPSIDDMERIVRLTQKYGIEMLSPPGS
jgi:mannose-6-phosphate isomerase-like protein (cupin superfamily)